MRIFVAVDIPDNLKESILHIQKELAGHDTKLIEKENLHFTLKFIGEADEGKMNDVMNILGDIKTGPFTVNLKSTGFFPSSNFIRVVWIGAESREFAKLHEDVNEALASICKEEKPVPHLTLARVRSQKFKKELVEFNQRHENEEFGSFEVLEIKLKKSVLSIKGPAYSDVKAWKL